MKWLLKILGMNTSGIGDLAKDIRESIKGKELDPNKQLEQATKIVELQTRINEVEAGHRTIFVAGWRPFVGWVSGLGLAYVSFAEPLIRFIARVNGYTGDFPEIDTTVTLQVLMGMLGLSYFRTEEKKKGISK